ncbi:MAG: phosphatase PAP2 family protein [Acidobacteriota bacterium]
MRVGALWLAGAFLLSPDRGRAESLLPACPGENEPEAVAPPAVSSAASNPDAAANLPKMALDDAVYILGSPGRWTEKDWVIAGGAVLGVVVSAMADVPVRDATQHHRSAALDDLTRVVEPFGSEYSWGVLGAYGVAGFLLHDADARDTAIDGVIASVIASGIITPSLKRTFGRARPDQTDDPLTFRAFHSGFESLPSGHATQAFAVASVISAHSDKVWVSASAYTLAGLVAFARVYHNVHWTSDVAAGALIGTLVGRGVVALNRRIRSGDHSIKIVFAPIFSGVERGAGVTVLF